MERFATRVGCFTCLAHIHGAVFLEIACRREISQSSHKHHYEFIDCILYLSSSTRPRMAHGGQPLRRHISRSEEMELTAAKEVLRYINTTKELSLWCTKWRGGKSAESVLSN